MENKREKKRIRDYGIAIGSLPTGKWNKISDVPGVTVGHCTIESETHQTGVTVVMPEKKNPYLYKLPAASFVLNGFGKTQGLVQIDELGSLETPIALTNTLNVGLVHDAMVEYMLGECKRDGVPLYSINPVVCECNDSSLNKIEERAVRKEHVFRAIEEACEDFEEGSVGAGRGTSCYGLKGGIGSSSRQVELDGKTYTVGVLVQSNHGKTANMMIQGRMLGKEILESPIEPSVTDRGSIIMIIATDLPVSDRQLRRMIKRASVGLIRTGSFLGHGSGDIMVGFSTAYTLATKADPAVQPISILNENVIEICFDAVAQATEEAILNSMICADPVKGYRGEKRSLSEWMKQQS
ncbi:MAG: P1 family peptidase [Lachnospiraceae bacterium]|nr:P1 family peptidase [Robinsoniella sp.]MDY3767770.1 P1 family peptidase [Lachnospiraceae bacterium]